MFHETQKVVEELKSRKRIQSADDLYSTALSDQSDSSDLSDLSDQSDQSDLSALSISDLYNLYLGWPRATGNAADSAANH